MKWFLLLLLQPSAARSNFPRVTQTELCINLLLFWQRAAVNLFITKTPALSPHAALAKRREGWLPVVSSTLPAEGSHSQCGSSWDAENSRNLLWAFKSLILSTLTLSLALQRALLLFPPLFSTGKVGAGHGLASGRSPTNQRFHVNNCLLWLFRNSFPCCQACKQYFPLAERKSCTRDRASEGRGGWCSEWKSWWLTGQEVRRSTGATHLSRDSRVQIAPKLLEVRVWWVFHLESLLWIRFERRKKENLRQCGKWHIYVYRYLFSVCISVSHVIYDFVFELYLSHIFKEQKTRHFRVGPETKLGALLYFLWPHK